MNAVFAFNEFLLDTENRFLSRIIWTVLVPQVRHLAALYSYQSSPSVSRPLDGTASSSASVEMAKKGTCTYLVGSNILSGAVGRHSGWPKVGEKSLVWQHWPLWGQKPTILQLGFVWEISVLVICGSRTQGQQAGWLSACSFPLCFCVLRGAGEPVSFQVKMKSSYWYCSGNMHIN